MLDPLDLKEFKVILGLLDVLDPLDLKEFEVTMEQTLLLYLEPVPLFILQQPKEGLSMLTEKTGTCIPT